MTTLIPELQTDTPAAPAVEEATPDAATPGTPAAHQIKGHLDDSGPVWLTGWVTNALAPGVALEIDVFCDGAPIAGTVANLFRGDLLAAGIGDGKCGFKMAMPEGVFDGATHNVEVREKTTGTLLNDGERTVKAFPAMRGDVVLEGAALRGHAQVADRNISVDELVVVDDGQVVCKGRGWFDDRGLVQFHAPLPAKVFDGRPHGFIVRTADQMLTLGAAALVMPFQLTPESALLQYAREGLKPSMSTAAGFRYEALTGAVREISDALATQTDAKARQALQAELAQVMQVHQTLVRGFSEKDTTFAPLTFPKVSQPKVSIVIPVHNKFHVTYHCLASLLLARNAASFEVILVDDGSKDISKTIPELIKGVKYVRNDEAEGFIRACNKGGTLATGEYIVMLNNDTEVTSGWLDELVWAFDHFDNVGMAGAKLLYPDGTLQEAGGVVWSSGNPWNYGRQANPREPRFNYARQVDYLSGACVMLPLKLWKEIGGFSETYVPAYFEDTDLGFQVRDRGFKTVYVPFAQVVHFEGISNGTSVASGTKRYQEINRPKFKARWINACRSNGKEGVDLELNKDRNVTMRALVIDAETPMPDQNAGSFAAISEIRMLQALGFKCTFVPQNNAWMGHYTEALQRMGVECLYAPFTANVQEAIAKRGSEFDLVYITRYYVAEPLVDLVRQHAPQAKIVLCNADLHFLRELRAALMNKNGDDLAKSTRTRDAELGVMRKVDLVLSYTDVEKAVIQSHNLDSTKVAKCPWVTEVAKDVPGIAGRADVAFLGGYNHHPNVEAVEWFVANVMPLLRQSQPGVKFRVFGSNVPKSLLALAEKHDDVVIDGWVADVAEVYNTCRVFVAPLQSGAGIKGKVIGALAYGVPCVLSPVAAEGIAVAEGVDALVAAKPEAWVAAITKVYANEAAWASMSANALRFADTQYGLEKGVTGMQEALEMAELFCTTENSALVLR